MASIQDGTGQYHKERKTSKIEQLMDMAFEITLASGKNSFLVLHAYFAVGPVFQYAKNIAKENIMPIHILTRAKKNIVAYFEPKMKKEVDLKNMVRQLNYMSYLQNQFISSANLAQKGA